MNRVVITGMGAITPIGNDVESFWQNLLAGQSGAAPITKFDSTNFRTNFACEVKGYSPLDHFDRKDLRKYDLYTQYALVTARQALSDANLNPENINLEKAGVIWGTGNGGITTLQTGIEEYALNKNLPRFNPYFMPMILSNMASGIVAMEHGFKGITYTAVSACASANSAFMDALNYIRLGKADVMIAGSSDAPIVDNVVGGFNAMRALSRRNDDPTKASRPFDTDRDGFVLGEGGGAFAFESLEHAQKRGANILAEVAGAGMASDAYHLTSTHPEGEGAARAMKQALEDANMEATELDYINAHATSTSQGDISESKGIATVFEGNEKVKVSATKSITGHLLGAAGAIEAIACVKAIEDNKIPPTINLENLDPEVPYADKIVFHNSIEQEVNVAMNNNFGFGGHNAVVIFKAFDN
ncbi:MAG: beta-ketoacyl-ACP synthase II [bacterium]|nr:beta-ketoacyl-ACP synthase II [bacterium]